MINCKYIFCNGEWLISNAGSTMAWMDTAVRGKAQQDLIDERGRRLADIEPDSCLVRRQRFKVGELAIQQG